MVLGTRETGQLLKEALERPWFALYFQRLPCSVQGREVQTSASANCDNLPEKLGQNLGSDRNAAAEKLPEDLLRRIFQLLSPADLATVSRVCRTFFTVSFEPALWRRHCLDAWGDKESLVDLTARACRYDGWRRMYRTRSHLHFHGLYIQKQQYLRIGGDDGTGTRRVFFVSFYRYLRFFPGGKVLGMTTPEDPLASRARLQTTRWDAPTQSQRSEVGAGGVAYSDQVVPVAGEYLFDEQSGIVTVTLPIHQPRYAEMQGALVCYVLALSDADGRPRGANDLLKLLEHSTLSADGSAPTYHEVKPSQAEFHFTPFGSQFRKVAEKLFADPEDVKMFNRVQLMQRPSRLQPRRAGCVRIAQVS